MPNHFVIRDGDEHQHSAPPSRNNDPEQHPQRANRLHPT